MTDDVLFEKKANAKLVGRKGKWPSGGGPNLSYGLTAVPELADKLLGGTWVGGRVSLTRTDLRFAPNSVNRNIHEGSMDIAIALSAITGTRVAGGIGTKIVEVAMGKGGLPVPVWR